MNDQYLRKYTRQNLDKRGNTLLHKAVKKADFVLLFKCAALETNVNKQNTEGLSALHYAVKRGRIDVVEAVLQCGVDPTLRTKLSHTAREMAETEARSDLAILIDQYSPGLCQALLDGVGLKPRDMGTALKLLRQWVSLANVDRSAATAAQLASDCLPPPRHDLVTLKHYDKTNLLVHLVGADEYEQVQLLLKRDGGECGIGCVHPLSGYGLLALAVRNHSTRMVKLLLQYGADPHQRLRDGTPLSLFVLKVESPFALLLALLSSTYEIKETRENAWHMREPLEGLTPFFAVAKQQWCTDVHLNKLLTITDCQVLRDCDNQGRNFLQFCAAHGRTDLRATVFTALSAQINDRPRSGAVALLRVGLSLASLPILRAVTSSSIEVSSETVQATLSGVLSAIDRLETEAGQLLTGIRNNNISVVKKHNVADFIFPNGRNALHEAVLSGHLDIAQWVVTERPQLLRMSDSRNRFPLHYAYGVGELHGQKFVTLLLEHSATSDLATLTDLNNKRPTQMHLLSDIEDGADTWC